MTRLHAKHLLASVWRLCVYSLVKFSATRRHFRYQTKHQNAIYRLFVLLSDMHGRVCASSRCDTDIVARRSRSISRRLRGKYYSSICLKSLRHRLGSVALSTSTALNHQLLSSARLCSPGTSVSTTTSSTSSDASTDPCISFSRRR